MSATLTASPAASVPALLDALHQQQSAIPENQRGLSKELAQLRDRLEKDPSVESDPQYLTQVAWLVQDWQKFSGTNQEPALSLLLQAGFTSMVHQYPGLQNDNLRQLLEDTAQITDRDLVTSIRATVMDVAQLSPDQQNSFMVNMAEETLTRRVMDAPVRLTNDANTIDHQNEIASGQPIPRPEGIRDIQEGTERGVQQKSEPSLSSQPPEATAQSGLSQSEELPFTPPAHEDTVPQTGEDHGVSSGASEHQAPPSTHEDHVPEPDDTLPGQDNQLDTDSATRPVSEPEVHHDAPSEDMGITEAKDKQIRRDDKRQSDASEQQDPDVTSAHKNKGQAQRQSTQKTNQQQPSEAQAAAPPAAPSVMSRAASAFATWGANARAGADRRRIDKLVTDVDQDISNSRSNHQRLKNVAAPFFKKLEQTAAKEGVSIPQVIAQMGLGGKHETLGQEFMQERMKNPEVRSAYENLVGSLSNMKRNVLSLQAEAGQRQATEDPAVKMAEQRVGELGMEVESVPGVDPGKNLIQTIGDIVEKLVEKARDFLGLNKQHEQGRDNGPSMGA